MNNDSPNLTPRRKFLQRMSVGSAALLAGGLTASSAKAESDLMSPSAVGDEWLERIHGDHKQVVDIATPSDGFGFAYAVNFLASFDQVDHLNKEDACSVAVFRHSAIGLVMNDHIWEKYKLGERLDVNDPETGEHARRNFYLDGIPGYFTFESAVNEMGVIVVACNMALTFFARGRAEVAGMEPQAAVQEWEDNVVDGVTLVPTGVYAVNRAQARGCTYCYGG